MKLKRRDAKKKVLIVDDEHRDLEVTEVMVKDLGYRVITATDGKDCLRLAKRKRPDLIILDIIMPEPDGSKVAELLSENRKTKDIPIIFLTCLVKEGEERRHLDKFGRHNFVAKPLDKVSLSKAIKEVFGA